MRKLLIASSIIVAAVACGKGTSDPKVASSSTAGADAPKAPSLPSGTTIAATTQRTVSSKDDKAGAQFTASVSQDVMGSGGKVLIPAGSTLNLTITDLQQASSKGDADGNITVQVNSVTVGGQTYPLSANITSMAHTLQGQGITTGQAEKTAAGAVIGGITGRIVGGNSKGTIIGAVIGGAAGAVVGSKGKPSDVVVAAGSPIEVTLTGPVTIRGQ